MPNDVYEIVFDGLDFNGLKEAGAKEEGAAVDLFRVPSGERYFVYARDDYRIRACFLFEWTSVGVRVHIMLLNWEQYRHHSVIARAPSHLASTSCRHFTELPDGQLSIIKDTAYIFIGHDVAGKFNNVIANYHLRHAIAVLLPFLSSLYDHTARYALDSIMGFMPDEYFYDDQKQSNKKVPITTHPVGMIGKR